MLSLVGLVIVFVMVFGGYILAGGKMGIILKALPFEMMMIGGAAIGTFLIANDGKVIKGTFADILKVIKGPKWKKQDYQDLLCLLFQLTRMAKANPMQVEEHIEDPHQSSIFNQYPKISADHHVTDFICDTMRAAIMTFDDPNQVDDALDRELEQHHHEAMKPAEALQTIADALPALGIVAAVLGVIKTMASIDQPPTVLGKLIGGALVGTFLGVFLAYGMVAPLSGRIKAIHDADHRFFTLIKDVLVAYFQGHAPQLCIEIARKNMPSAVRPKFADVESALAALKKSDAGQAQAA